MISQQTQSESITLSVTNQVGSTQKCQLLPNEGIFVGKSSNCRLQLTGEDLSDIHCRIEFNNGKVSIQDWMSAAGTQVNGEAITAQVQLATDDVIQIGQHHIRLATEGPQSKGTERRSDSTETLVDTPETPVDTSSDQGRACSAADSHREILADTIDQRPDIGVGLVSIEAQESMDIDNDFFGFEEEETYDRETVALLHAEIEELQTALAQRDAESFNHEFDQGPADSASVEAGSDAVLERMQELMDEANRSDERVAILEEMLFAAEVASRSDQEERGQLEAWVGDIEKRIGQREDEHKAEIDALRLRLKESSLQQERLQKQLRQAAGGGRAPESYEETLENLQSRNVDLQDKLAESEKDRSSLERRLEEQCEVAERALRDERVTLAQEKAKVSRMRFELSNKLSDIDEMPKTENQVDMETAHKIRTLREHLREIHEQEKQEAKDAPLATRLARLWNRVEY